MVGSAIERALRKKNFSNILIASRKELDLRDTAAVEKFFQQNQPDYVFSAAAKVGGILANIRYPADFLYDNLMIQTNIIHASMKFKVKKLLLLGSSCVYPYDCPQPMKEEYLLTGLLEPTNEGYALAKIAGLKMCQYYQTQHGLNVVCPMPCNLYGTNDSFDPEHSHVLSALVKKFCDAVYFDQKEVVVWGTGKARREFMHVDDAADACLFLMDNFESPEIINVGWGIDISINELAYLIAKKTKFKGEICNDPAMPDGMMRKCLDISKISNLGFQPKIALDAGLDEMISVYRKTFLGEDV